MFSYGIARRLIADIPPQYGNPDRVCRNDSWIRIVTTVPEKRCSFNDDDLDMTDYNPYAGTRCVIRISKAPEDCREYVKLWVLDNIDRGSKPPTQDHKCKLLCRILCLAEERSTAKCFRDISTRNLVDSINILWPKNHKVRINAFKAAIRFFDFIHDEKLVSLPVDIRRLAEETQFLVDMLAGFGEAAHSPILDDEYEDRYMNGLDKVMRDENRTFNERMTAGIALLDTQLGLRISEIPALETNCIRQAECIDGKTRPYIVYNCLKRARGNAKVVKVKTICTGLAKETVTYLLELRKLCPEAADSRFLYVLDDEDSRNGKPVKIDKFRRRFKELSLRYMNELVSTRHCGIRPVTVNDVTCWIPAMHSFRATFADRLYRMGFNIDYINCIMSHTHKESDACNNAYIQSTKKVSNRDVEDLLGEMMEENLYND